MFSIEYKEEPEDSDLVDCQGNATAPEGKACRLDFDEFGPWCNEDEDFGYKEGMPCVLLKLNKVCSLLLLILEECSKLLTLAS